MTSPGIATSLDAGENVAGPCDLWEGEACPSRLEEQVSAGNNSITPTRCSVAEYLYALNAELLGVQTRSANIVPVALFRPCDGKLIATPTGYVAGEYMRSTLSYWVSGRSRSVNIVPVTLFRPCQWTEMGS